MAIIKRFTPVLTPKSLLANPQISLSAKGLYAFLQIFENGEKINMTLLPKMYNIDKELFDNSLRELIDFQYVSIDEGENGALFYDVEQVY